MKGIKLQSKLLIAFITATTSITLVMALFVNWNFGRGFAQYLNQSAIEKSAPIREALQDYYQRQGSWQGMRDKPNELRRIVLEGFSPNFEQWLQKRSPDKRALSPRAMERMQRKLIERHFREARFMKVYDREGRLVASYPKKPHHEDRRSDLRSPLRLDGEDIGYFVLSKVKLRTGHLAYEFRRQQWQSLWLIALFAVAISALMAWLFARHLIAPIRALANSSRDLGDGNYQSRVPVQGNDELASLSRDFNQLAQTLEKNEHSRKQWVADISHELRTPLAVLRGEIEAVLDGVRALDMARVQSLHNEVLTLTRLVDDLYQLALSDAGGMDYRFSYENLATVVEQSVDAFATRFAKAGLTLRIVGLQTLDDELRMDHKRFSQLMHNLLENSLRYTDAGGQVQLHCAQNDELIYIDIEDSAPGVPAAELKKIFERLYRVDQSRSRDYGGSGLGLSLCRNIVEAHGGQISASSSALGGVKISIVMPAIKRP